MQGVEIVSLGDACSLCKQYNVKLYAYCPTVQMNMYTSEEKILSYKNDVQQKAEGKFYTGDLNEMTTNIVNEIKETKKTLLKNSKELYFIDHPEMFLIISVILFSILIIIEKRIKL